MNYWKYNHFNEATNTIIAGEEIKEPYVWSVSQPDSDYTQITVITEEIRLEFINQQYIQFEKDGLNWYNLFRNALVDDINQSLKTQADVLFINETLEVVYCVIIRGDWKDAELQMTNVSPSGAYTQAIHDGVVSDIDEYITNNY